MESKLIISNTTPLINFAEIGRIDVLEALFGDITIPPAVVEELTSKADLFPDAAQVPSLPKIKLRAPEDRLLVQGLASHVHRGEAECLALAMEHPGALLLLDDLCARELAASNKLLFTGTLGCLIQAKAEGIIPVIKPLLQDLRTKSRFWISDALECEVLRSVNESVGLG
jgi:predicted nucleic acid-binding protein